MVAERLPKRSRAGGPAEPEPDAVAVASPRPAATVPASRPSSSPTRRRSERPSRSGRDPLHRPDRRHRRRQIDGAGRARAPGRGVLSTDAVVHELYETAEVRDAVVEHFGPEVARRRGDRPPALARAAFATDEQRAWLEGMLWPRVGGAGGAMAPRARARAPAPAGGGRGGAAAVRVWHGPGVRRDDRRRGRRGLRRQRASSRGHAALEQRAARQLSQEEKSGRATYTVVNDGTVEDLEGKLSAILEMLKS